MRKYVRQYSIKLTEEESKVVDQLTRQGEFRISVGQLFRKLLAAEAKRKRAA